MVMKAPVKRSAATVAPLSQLLTLDLTEAGTMQTNKKTKQVLQH